MGLKTVQEYLAGPTNFEGGPVSVGTEAVEISFKYESNWVRIQADTENTSSIYVGSSGVGTDGSGAVARLDPGEAISLKYDSLWNSFWVISPEPSQKVYKLGAYIE
ncbi:MAG: hypothetical protein DRN21_05580 [Thermoplasmata archaeon]|nr:MAG: hypothetical protein DRN21_05580 [Thermoplasmata archaeon]